MRIITGIARGCRLDTPEGEEITRPTPEKVKEAVFSSIQFDIEGREVLDLFAGSGQLGLEALSRGAKRCTFVDSSRESFGIIQNNAKKAKLYQASNVLCMDFKQYTKSAKGIKFDLIFLDPPYAKRLLCPALSALLEAGLIKETTIIVCEDENEDFLSEELKSQFAVKKQSKYGRVYITYLGLLTDGDNE